MLRKILESQTLKHMSVVLVGNLFSVLLGFGFVILTARRLGPAEFGVFSTILAYSIFISAVADLGVSQSIVKFFHDTKVSLQQKSWLSTGLFSVLLSSTVISGISALIYQFVLRGLWQHQSNGYWLPLLCMNIVIALNTFLLSYFQTREMFVNRAAIDNLFSIIRIVMTLYVISQNQLSVISGLWIIVLAYVVAIFAGITAAKKWLDPAYIEVTKVITLLGFGRWLAVSNIFSNLYGKLDILMLAWLVSAYQTGQYSAASRFITIFPLVVSSLSSVAAPRFAQLISSQDAKRYLNKLVLLSALVALGMMSLVFLGRFIIQTAYSLEFTPAVKYFQLLVIAYIPLIFSVPAGNVLVYFYKSPQLITLISLLQLFGLAALNYVLIPRTGAIGVILGVAIMNSMGMLMQYAFVIAKRNV